MLHWGRRLLTMSCWAQIQKKNTLLSIVSTKRGQGRVFPPNEYSSVQRYVWANYNKSLSSWSWEVTIYYLVILEIINQTSLHFFTTVATVCVCVCVMACWWWSRRQTEVSSVRQPLSGFLCQFHKNRSGFRARRLAFCPCDGWCRACWQPRMNSRLFLSLPPPSPQSHCLPPSPFLCDLNSVLSPAVSRCSFQAPIKKFKSVAIHYACSSTEITLKSTIVCVWINVI